MTEPSFAQTLLESLAAELKQRFLVLLVDYYPANCLIKISASVYRFATVTLNRSEACVYVVIYHDQTRHQPILLELADPQLVEQLVERLRQHFQIELAITNWTEARE